MNQSSSLRAFLSDEAERAPIVLDLASNVVAQAQRQRRRRWALSGAAVLLASAGSAAVVFDIDTGKKFDPASIAAVATSSRSLPDSGMADCEPPRTGADIAARDFAFAGRVTMVSPDAGTITPSATVTFSVDTWFKGGQGRTATVSMTAPLQFGAYRSEAAPSYTVGTKLLVSGDRGFNDRLRAGTCGYTRYFDAATNGLWRASTR